MDIKELKKYVNFYLHDKNQKHEYGLGIKLALETYGSYTYMIGHQPRSLTKEEVEHKKELGLNVNSELEYNDPYWTDDVGDPLEIDYSKLEIIDNRGLYWAEATVGDKKFKVIIENDCGFAVAYGSKEIYDLVQKAEPYKPLPDNVTIKESNIEGLGLFATKDIPKFTNLGKTHYEEFGRLERTPLGGFYNHSETPNCSRTRDHHLVTIEDIKAGEELTSKYTLPGYNDNDILS